ncbi:unnamed protein product [Cuscuta campestris]|uniref:NAB domain-containing protein n=1 Tax=Cuscuta campestris TaxID=132261 RepID=A0A484L1D4_9ASTE|nr:unnamed protein product [Cuscuta campestris]
MLKLIEQEGDSFAKRAEMYYKRRPELISSVEEAYRAFRALAERYDKLSKDLHTANHTIAIVFPEQIQLEMDEDEDDFGSPKLSKNLHDSSRIPKGFQMDPKNFQEPVSPKYPKAAKKASQNKNLSKTEALEEIEKLQSEISSLQTVKEIVKSSYENGLLRFQEIEKQIVEMQDRLCNLQTEFGSTTDVEKPETSLISVKESLGQLQEKQEKCVRDFKEESQKIEDAEKKLKSLKFGERGVQSNDQIVKSEDGGNFKEEESAKVNQLTIKIDELVNEVLNLEITMTSQTEIIDRLRTESNDLHEKIRILEGEKANLTLDKQNLSTRVEELEEQLQKLQNLHRDVEKQNTNLQSQLTEALSCYDLLSEKLRKDTQTVKHVTFADTKESKDSTQETQESSWEKDEKFNWQRMLLDGMEDREQVLLKEYIALLKSYKDLKKKLDDGDVQSEIAVEMKDLKNVIARKDEEILYLQQKLNLFQGFSEGKKMNSLENVEKKGIKSKDTNGIPLREFIFGTKPKKQKTSVFSCIQSKKYQTLKAGGH